MNENIGKGRIDPTERHFSVLPGEEKNPLAVKGIEKVKNIIEIKKRIKELREETDALIDELLKRGIEEPEIIEEDNLETN
ncbi:MAG: hypothetical protein WA060_03145 [Minisyncoccia bacterium]